MSEVPETKKSRGKPKRNKSSENQDADSSKKAKRKADEVIENSANKKCCAEMQHLATHVRIEHWADELVAALKPAFPQLEFSFNPNKPRRGAFEFVLLDKHGEETVIWSGLKRGPPRKEKFPEPEKLTELFKNHLSKE